MITLHTPLNTLSVPTHTQWCGLVALTLLLGSGSALAGIQHYQAPLDAVRWQTTSKKLYCALRHDIPLYGSAIFAQEAGGQLGFSLKTRLKARRNKDLAHLRALPPEWKRHIEVVDLGEVAVHKGGTPFQLKEDLSRRLLAELQKGMFPTFSYRDWADARDQVSVALPGINFKPVLGEFLDCLEKLPVYKFADFRDSLLHFDFGKSILNKQDRKRLDDLARYIKTDPALKYIDITGHTDNVGRKRSNDKLGQRRSKAVRDYLMAKGVPANLFKLKSLGERKPKASNRTDKGRAINRRARIRLVK